MRFLLVTGATETAAIDGISAAGADPDAMRYTPAADAELVTYGEPVFAPAVPVSPTGCPTPALFTRAVRDLVDFDVQVVDAGLAARTAAPTHSVAPDTGGDVRSPEPVPEADRVYRAARELGSSLPDSELYVGESIPGGTTTALGVLSALGADHGVSSSLPENPIDRKRAVVAEGLDASGIEAGGLAGQPLEAVRRMGDPVLAAVAGVTAGALEAGTDVTLAGGTQQLAAAALVRHAGVTDPVAVATTSFVADDEAADVRGAADAFDVTLRVTDPGFGATDHVAMARYRRGEAKEGAGMGGALQLAERAGVPLARVRERVAERYDELVGTDES